MISVSRKDWRTRSVLGSEMEESELEEGEALNYHPKGNKDSAIGSDINSLSYIEEKIESVLGHFQKDFEGGVNLGSRFDGYGSFLPAYQRSPEAVHSSQRSPKKDRKPNSVAPVSASPSVRSSTAPGKRVSTGNVSKGRGKLESGIADKLAVKTGSIEKPVNSLKLRIKVGSENLSTSCKNVDIYNGLGLVSPSSSIDGSPAVTGGQDVKVLNMPDESPTSILQIMTSFPGDILLSPLSEDLIHLNRNFRGTHKSRNVAKTSTITEKSVMSVNGFHSSKSNEKTPEAKRLKSSASELAYDKTVLTSKKEYETDDDAAVCEDIVSNALKLPLLSSSEYGGVDHGKDMPTAATVPAHNSKDGTSGETLSSSIPARDTGRVGNSGSSLGSSCNVLEYDKRKSLSNNAAGPATVKQTVEVSCPLDQSEFSGSKVKKSRGATEPAELPKHLVFHEGGSEDGKPYFDSSSPKGHSKKQKGAQATRKDESKKENENQAYKDFFGDEEFDDDEEDDDDDENESLYGELTSAGRLKDRHVSGKTSFTKERSNSKSLGNLQAKEKYATTSSHSAAPLVNGTSTNAPTLMPPLVNENWVSCDICQLWRLLPLDTDPKSLPDKWTCSMLMWLPGMNRCYIPEDVTTNALRALYQPAVPGPAPISEGKQIGIAAGYPDQQHQSIVMKTGTNGKKKNGSVKTTNSTDLDGSTRSSSSKKKTPFPTGKGSNLSGGNSSPSTDAGRYQLPGRSSSGAEKLENGKRKMSVFNCSNRGAHLSVKSKQEADVECSKPSKRVKSDELHFDSENLVANNAGSPLKGGNASTSFSNDTSDNEHRRSRHRIDFPAVDKKNSVSDLNVANNASVHSGKHDEKDSSRKRKGKEHRLPETHSEKRVKVSKSAKGLESDDRKSADNNQVSDYFKGDLGQLQPSVAANSSSSKVSGSHKNKIGGQEVKGSPVESVSSSPLRYHVDADKASSKVKKSDVEDCRSLTAVSPRRLSSGDGGSNGQAEMKKNEGLASCNNVSDFHDRAKNSLDQRKVEGRASVKHSKSISLSSGRHMEKVSSRALDSSDHQQLYEEKSKSRRNKSEEKSGTTNKGEKSISRKETALGTPNEKKRFSDDAQDAIKSADKLHDIREHDAEKSSQKGSFTEVHGNAKSYSLPPLARAGTETAANHEPGSGSKKDKGVNVSAADVVDQKIQIQKTKAENSSVPLVRLSTPSAHKVRDVDAPSPVRRESSSHGANSALKEATDLKHTADRMKNAGSPESIGLYFQACLKFLHGAFLLESGGSETSKHNELLHSMHIYSTTAKLCEYCAHEYEKLEDMAAAALAYKCVEVAYMRVVYSSHPSASRDRNELQSALQIAAPGESPSSSASDVDNLNHQAAGPEKGALARVGGSPHVSGSHVFTSRNRAGFLRVLNFAQDVSFAMEASRKSRLAFTAAMLRFSETSNEEAVSSLKKALDYAFQDVDGFLRLVRVAMEAISR